MTAVDVQPARKRLMPADAVELGRAWQCVLALVSARRQGLDADGAMLLDGRDADAVLWAAVHALAILLDSLPQRNAEAVIRHWALTAARGDAGLTGPVREGGAPDAG